MPHCPLPTFIISKQDDKIVVVARKLVLRGPEPVLRTRREKLFGCLWPIIVFGIIIGVICYLLADSTIKEREAVALQTLCVAAFLTFALLRTWAILFQPNPEHEDVVLTFGADKFEVWCRGMTTSFSYSRDTRPMLRQDSCSAEYVDVIIPCLPLDDDSLDGNDDYYALSVPSEFRGGYYEMQNVPFEDAEWILFALEKQLDAI